MRCGAEIFYRCFGPKQITKYLGNDFYDQNNVLLSVPMHLTLFLRKLLIFNILKKKILTLSILIRCLFLDELIKLCQNFGSCLKKNNS